MKIVFLSLYYEPEKYSSSYVMKDVMRYLKSKGNDIVLLCPTPVRGIDNKTIDFYKKHPDEETDCARIFRLKTLTHFQNNKIFHVLKILLFKKRVISFLKHNIDIDCVVVPSNPPLFLPSSVMRYCHKNRIKCLYDIDDIFPDIMGIKNNLLNKVFSRIVLDNMNLASAITVLSKDMKNTLINKGVTTNIVVTKIWENDVAIDNSNDYINHNLKLDLNRKNIFYIGNIGYFQNIMLLVNVFNLITLNKNDINCYFVGSGRNENKLISVLDKLNNKNIKFIGRVEENVAKQLYNISDLNLISLNKNVIKFACPSKTAMCIGAKKPALLICDNSYYSSYLKNNFNFAFDDSFDENLICDKICEILDKKSKNNRSIGMGIYDKKTNLDIWLNVFMNLKEKIYEK